MSKNEIELKLHETLCEKDKLTEQATQAMREKLEVDNAMIQLVHENGILKEENNELKDATRGISSQSHFTDQQKKAKLLTQTVSENEQTNIIAEDSSK